MTQEEKGKLFPRCGRLYPDGLQLLQRADSYDAVRDVASRYSVKLLVVFNEPIFFLNIFFPSQEYKLIFEGTSEDGTEKTIEDKFFEQEVRF